MRFYDGRYIDLEKVLNYAVMRPINALLFAMTASAVIMIWFGYLMLHRMN